MALVQWADRRIYVENRSSQLPPCCMLFFRETFGCKVLQPLGILRSELLCCSYNSARGFTESPSVNKGEWCRLLAATVDGLWMPLLSSLLLSQAWSDRQLFHCVKRVACWASPWRDLFRYLSISQGQRSVEDQFLMCGEIPPPPPTSPPPLPLADPSVECYCYVTRWVWSGTIVSPQEMSSARAGGVPSV